MSVKTCPASESRAREWEMTPPASSTIRIRAVRKKAMRSRRPVIPCAWSCPCSGATGVLVLSTRAVIAFGRQQHHGHANRGRLGAELTDISPADRRGPTGGTEPGSRWEVGVTFPARRGFRPQLRRVVAARGSVRSYVHGFFTRSHLQTPDHDGM